MIITEDVLRGALRVLQTTPPELQNAVYEARKAENLLRHIKALEMKKHSGAIGAQEREAYASEAYRIAIHEDAKATGALAILKARIEAAKMAIEIWRTESATERASYG